MDSILSPSPSVKIQIIGGKVYLRWCQQTFCFQKFVDITQQCFALLPQVNFPANNLSFHWRWRWWDRIQAIFLNLFYFTTLTFESGKWQNFPLLRSYYWFSIGTVFSLPRCPLSGEAELWELLLLMRNGNLNKDSWTFDFLRTFGKLLNDFWITLITAASIKLFWSWLKYSPYTCKLHRLLEDKWSSKLAADINGWKSNISEQESGREQASFP